MMISINPVMTIAALLILPVSFMIIKIVVSRSQGYFRDQQNFLGDVNGHVEEMYTGHTIIKAFGREEVTTADFDSINDKLYSSAWRSQFFSGLMMPLTALVGNLGYVAMCVVGGYLAYGGIISIGNIQTFLLYVRNLNQPVQNVANIMNLLQSTAAAAERIFDLIEEDEEEDAFARSVSATCVSATIPKNPSSRISAMSRSPARESPSSARPAPAKRPSSSCLCGSMSSTEETYI